MNLKPLPLVIALAATGCATIVAGGPDKISVATNPPGASVYVDEQLVGQTPTMVSLDRSTSQGRIRLELPGYQPVLVQRPKVINGWFWGNLCLGVLPIVIDLVTGDVKRFDDSPIAVGLVPGGAAPGPAGPSAYPGSPPPPPPR